jgi:hypothetical protein
MTADMPVRNIALHMVSDSTGETLGSIARATLARFDEPHVIKHSWSLIRSRFQLDRVLGGISSEPGPVLFTIADRSLRHALEEHCAKVGVPCMSVLDPVMDLLQAAIGARALDKRAAQHGFDKDYFRRLDAINYVFAHDDGQGVAGIRDADVCLVGVSRSSKTPTCFYLANRGVKAANVPIVPNVPLPPELADAHCPVVGLYIDAHALIEIRRHRLKVIGADKIRHDVENYVDHEAVKKEIQSARRLCTENRWPVIDVTRRSIEETAATVMQHIDEWQARHPEYVKRREPQDPAASVLASA